MRDTRVDFTLAAPPVRSPYLTYEPYYGLREKPFSLSADPRFLFKGRMHAPVFDALRSGIRRREGIIVLTGEPGTGKTTLCRSVLEALDRKTFCTFVPDPFVSREDLLKMLLIEFGVMSVDDLKSGRLRSASRPELSYPLYDFLRSLVPLQAYAVLILDEAQNLTSQLLEEIRILADLEGPEKLLQLVLVGQPELHEKLKDPAMRQVDQRISVRCALDTLERDALEGYLAHRLAVAGDGANRIEFSAEARGLVDQSSMGNTRVRKLIAHKSLTRGDIERTWVLSRGIV
jgi:general secretion pathway protein A